ncbi:MAG: membrane protein insertase YidC [Candidatus Westeberhardia cardiocondylae]|nr:membrane protein insertase YidC [Candidatus Westeberhardia cardiocondylae]
MDLQRNILIIALLVISFIIWQEWKKDCSFYNFSSEKQINLSDNINDNLNSNNDLIKNKQGKLITIKTDVLSIIINTHGGDIEHAFLLTYPKKVNSFDPFHLLKTSSHFVYQVQSGLIGKNGPDSLCRNEGRPLYFSDRNYYALEEHEDKLFVPLIYISQEGIVYKKIFIFYRNSFVLEMYYDIDNLSDYLIELVLFGQLKQSILFSSEYCENDRNFSLHAYRGVAYSSCNDKYKKYTFEDIKKNNLCLSTKNGWIAMLQKYFVTAWIPNGFNENVFYTKYLPETEQAIVGFRSSPIKIFPHSKFYTSKSTLWIGPEIQDVMSKVAPYLDLTVDYGWLWFISQPLLKLLKFIYKYIGNWGFSIIIITFVLRVIMYPLTKIQYTTIARMRILQPKLAKIREIFDGNKQRQSQEMILLYKKEKINPLNGFLPLLIQMPIFLGLYYMLSNSIELRHAYFVLWIYDLSERDSYYILPILMGLTMFVIQKLFPSSSIVDPIQKKIAIFIPILFTLFFLWFPSGLVLYYIISNFVTIIQQKFIYRSLKKQGLYVQD